TVDSTRICKDCGYCYFSECLVPDSSDLYEGRTIRREALDGSTIDPGKRRNDILAESVIQRTITSLCLETIETRVKSLYNMVEKKFEVGEGQLLRLVVGACALLAIREEKIPKTMREVAFILGLEFRNLTAVVHKIRAHILPSVPSFIDVELLVINAINKLFENQNVKLPIYTDIRQLDHLKYDLSVLNAQHYDDYFDEEITNNSNEEFSVLIMKSYRKVFFSLCMELLKYSDNDNLVSGRQPSPIGAAVVLLAIEATEKPSFDEWKNNHRRASEMIGRIFQIDPKLTMCDRYREMINLMHSKFHKWVLNCREKGRQNVRHSDQDTNNELIEIETNEDLDCRDVGHELKTDGSDFFLDDDELEDYVRDEDEVELAKESWELYHQEKQSKDAKSKLPTKRCRVLREKGISKKSKTNDVNNNRNTHLETTLENKSVTLKRKYTKKADKIDAMQERVQIESSTSKIKLNFDPNQINMALFDHI
ncbi:10286_t:CDS:2, partial [Cetraspora pellucida]